MTTDWIQFLTDDKPDDPSPVTRATTSDRVRALMSLTSRLMFFIWLYDITDGAAFSPFAFIGGAFGGTVWQPVLAALGLTD